MRIALLSCFALSGLLFSACGGEDESPNSTAPDASMMMPDAAVAASCLDGKKNGDETDVDCGGSCEQKCRPFAACESTDDCDQGTAHNVACTEAQSAAGFGPKACLVDHVSCYPNPCDAAHVCVQYQSFNGAPAAFCEKRHAAGEYCQERDPDANDCVDGYTCQPGTGFDNSCKPAPTAPKKIETEECLNDVDCASGLFCDNNYKCKARGGLYDSCFSGNIPCQYGLQCEFPSGLACTDWVQCGSNMACCATETGGAECREGAWNSCTPPRGECRHF